MGDSKKISKVDSFRKTMEQKKEDRPIPAVGVPFSLSLLETQIDNELGRIDTSFFNIGKSLAEIQEKKEYPERTFELYLKRRWNRERNWGYRMIEGYKVKSGSPENVSNKIQTSVENKELNNLGQALALGKVPKEKRTEVLKKVEGKITIRKIQEAAIESDFRVVVRDANDEEVPEEIAGEFQRAEREAKEQVSFAQHIKNYLERDDITTVEARSLRETAKDLLAGLKTHLTKHVICPKCRGKKCAVCSRRGFVSNHFATKGMGK